MEIWQILLIYVVGIFVLLYCLTILPSKRKNKQMRELHDSIAPGDQVSTIGGIIGTVTDRGDEIVTLRIDDEANVTMRVTIYAVSAIIEKAAK